MVGKECLPWPQWLSVSSSSYDKISDWVASITHIFLTVVEAGNAKVRVPGL